MALVVGTLVFLLHRYDKITTEDSTIIHVKTPKHHSSTSMSPYMITINITQQLRHRRMSDLNLNEETLPTKTPAADIEAPSAAVYGEETKKTL